MTRRLLLSLPCFLLLAPAAWPQGGPVVELSLRRAVEIALAPQGNARIRLAEEAVRQAESRSAQTRAALLPNIEASVSQQNQLRNLEAFGLRLEAPVPGIAIPKVVGPFNTFDARAAATQTVFDFSSVRRWQASRAGIGTAGAERDAMRDLIARQVAGLYLAGIRAEARVQTAEANVALAEDLVKLAQNQLAAGAGTAIEVSRAQVQLANERQHLLVAENERRRAHLELLKALGMRLDAQPRLAETLEYAPAEAVAVEETLAQALEARSDYRAQRQREEAARLSYSSARMERLPSVVGFADYGSIGTSIHNAIPTRTFGLSLRLPVFDGGRRDARRGESRSQLEQERIRTRDLREEIELEIRLALDTLHSSEEQVRVAQGGRVQAEDELDRARRRYAAGMASSLEITDAQTRLARARDNYIAALFLYNQARLDLWQATGALREKIQ